MSDPDLFSLEIHHGGYISEGKYVRGKNQPHFPESQASASTPQLGLEVEVETETDVGELGNQFVEVDVDLDDDGYDEVHKEGDNEADDSEDDEAEDDDSVEEAEDDDSVEEAEDDDSETDIELIDSEFEQSDEEGLKRVLEEDDNLFDKHVVDEENDEYNEEPGEVDSEDYNTDDLVSLDEESDEGEGVKNRSRRRKAPRFKQFRRESDLLKPTFHLGMEFTNMEQCREAIRYYAVSCARPLKWVTNDSNRVRLKCEGDKKQKVPCPWMLYASHVGKGPSTRIKTYVPRHTCGRRQRTKYATSSWLSKRFDEELRDNPKMKVTDFMKLIRKHYAIDVTEAQVYKAKSFAKKRILGSIEEQYGKLWDYCEELKSNNPGSTVIVKTELQGENPIFKRIYVCFGALKKGFVEGCRQVVGFDGCHVKGSHPGQILSAVGIDGNNGMYPIAFAVVEVENTETWGIENGNGWVFITDKQKGLGNALHALMPNAEHRHCVRHLHNNFKLAGHTGAAFKQRLWAAARATTIPVFEAEMEQMLGQSQAAYKWLQERPAAHWSRSHFSTVPKCDILLNNLCECFNAAILEARDKPIVTLLERIRTYLMLRMARLRETVWPHEVGPRIFGIVEKNSIESGHCIASYAGGGKYQVNSMLGAMFVVDLERHTCTCRKWDLSGIPCPHALASIAKSEHSPLDFVHALYKRPAYDRAYEGYISPMPSQAYWRKTGHVPIKPPVYRIQPGRPKLSRNREADEIPKGATKLKRYGIVITCRNCGQEGHNFAGCPQLRQGQPRGRARCGRRGRGAVRGRGARGKGAATANGDVDTTSVNASGTTASGTTTVRGVKRGRGVVSEQQQTQARPKFNVSLRDLCLEQVKRGAQAPYVIRKTNVFADSQAGQSSQAPSGPAPSKQAPSQSVPHSQGPSQPAPRSQAPPQPAQSSQAHQGSSSQPQPMVTSPKRPRLKSPAKRIRPWRV
ncbi:hypothetical protein Prudu_001853 [Prunus dulcis]|uniref:SWIM-type domain-containing protein n=2 Tax=Prunus dulcis TaxID=3755 RepID=A0A4Y1QPF0_PRUDU|nr:hypothetical protein Prudu_001853 [Prunus dulcis]